MMVEAGTQAAMREDNDPLIAGIDDYLMRFVKNDPKLAKATHAIRTANCGWIERTAPRAMSRGVTLRGCELLVYYGNGDDGERQERAYARWWPA